ncbi:HNH endonuclease [Deinococcus humi]|uniref:5-methylcytosine-specific restriction protein A n=1 Tax=Deinococcus humi TaxID=662880 RepID=A0A7W8JU93_9DEIO|nr:HNH endonuclease [Deinococcus humi]MBB5362043.1 5-methylcytosine-specific restriction protein A [Deinococcus humi]GGO22352.1 hypothetical protein GCM10008949_09520 [Deinococcus humi]
MLVLEHSLRLKDHSVWDRVAIRELSDVLRRLDFHPPAMIHENFRSESSVTTKLKGLMQTVGEIESNKLDYDFAPGSGHLDRKVILEFAGDYVRLKSYTDFWRRYGAVPESVFQDTRGVGQPLDLEEGRRLLKEHYKRERKPRIVREKLQSTLEREGQLLCEVCGFNFNTAYGKLGEGFAECHHLQPLGELPDDEGVTTTLDDLAVVCSNCHRMLHRGPMMLSVEGLRLIVETQAAILDQEDEFGADGEE